MKKTMLILCLISCTLAMYAQNPRIETIGNRRTETYLYQKGGDSMRLTIVGKNDTVQKTVYYRSGKIEAIIWKKDSAYFLDALGNLTHKNYILGEGKYQAQNSISFYSNGARTGSTEYTKNGVIQMYYDINGRFLMSDVTERDTIGNFYNRSADRNNISIHVIKEQRQSFGIYRRYDTSFYDTGRPYEIKIDEGRQNLLTHKIYAPNGSVITLASEDNPPLIVFKDNINCAYGLKNKRDDTIVQARYTEIKPFGNGYWAAYSDEKAVLLDDKGVLKANPNFPASQINAFITFSREEGINPQNGDIAARKHYLKPEFPTYWIFSKDGKSGIMDGEGQIVMPPQYFPLEFPAYTDGKNFKFREYKNSKLFRVGFLNKEGVPLFPERFKNVTYAYSESDFFLKLNAEDGEEGIRRFNDWGNPSEKQHALYYGEAKNYLGLGKVDGTVVLEPKFCNISPTLNPLLLIATRLKSDDGNETGYFQDGMYNTHLKKWVLDTTGYIIRNRYGNTCAFFVVEHLPTLKYGIMDTAGKSVLPFSFDSIAIVDDVRGLFWIKKGNNYYLLTLNKSKLVQHKPKYDYLSTVKFALPFSITQEAVYYFLAKRNNKWGVVDVNDNVIKPFEYDYVSPNNNIDNTFYMVKNNQASCFRLNSLPNEEPIVPKKTANSTQSNPVNTYSLADDPTRFFSINDTGGKVMIPPQYKRLNNPNQLPNSDYSMVEDTAGDKQLIFFATGKVVDFPLNLNVKYAHPKKPFILVEDEGGSKKGVVSMNGELLSACDNYSIALCEEEDSIFFVKSSPPPSRDSNTPELPYQDTLTIGDNGWQMFDINGKALNTNGYRFPIDFRNGIGIGAIGDNFNLYKPDGSVFLPFSKATKDKNASIKNTSIDKNTEGGLIGYKNIRRDKETGYYIFFTNTSLLSSIVLTNKQGEILVESGHYDGISRFFDKYALVSSAGKIGLIDTFGQEIIAPQDLRTYTGHFMDSLNLVNTKTRQIRINGDYTNKDYYKSEVRQPFNCTDYSVLPFNPDSLKITKTQLAALWNLLLDKCLDKTIYRASDLSIPRIFYKTTIDHLSDMHNDDFLQTIPRRIALTSNTIAFALSKMYDYYTPILSFHNFYLKNNRWEELKINDLLMIQGEKRWLFNDLITKKVKALKDQQIDCSNASAFITTVENRWQLTRKGVDFYFESTENSEVFVVISFTWAELLPFLKMKIY